MYENPTFKDFHSLVSWYIRKNGITTDDIAARTGISERTITSLRADNAGNVKHDLNLLVAFAIALRMTSEHAILLINLNGQFLRDCEPTEQIYKYLLSVGSFYCVAACNDYLSEHGFAPLTDNREISFYE